jgi:hypothetical protein
MSWCLVRSVESYALHGEALIEVAEPSESTTGNNLGTY